MDVLSLFDGMSCGQLALQRAGIKYDNYFASEIDKYCIKVTQANFPNTIQLGDVTKVRGTDLPKIDLLIGGSPCQGFSFAGKGLNFQDERSKLFFEFVRLKNELQPKYFLLENVKMKQEHEFVISKYMGVSPIEINSALVSAQNRERLYWTNINEQPYGLFGDTKPDIPQPKNKKILLKDILEKDVDKKYYLTEKMINYLNTRKGNFNSGNINYKTGDDIASTINASSGAIDISDNIIVGCDFRKDEGLRIRESGKSGTLQARARNDESCAQMVMQVNANTESGGKQPYQQNRVYDTDGISPALMAEISSGTHVILEKGLNKRQQKNHKTEDEKASSFLSTSYKGAQANGMTLVGSSRIRRLTPIECERLQTVPDNYTNHVSDSQRYKMLGNGWTVDVIVHFFSFITPH